MAKTSDNTKGNKYHDDGGKFTFAPYKNYRGMEQSAKKLAIMRKAVEKDLNSGNWGSPECLEYFDEVSKERQKLQQVNGLSDYQIEQANYAASRWISGDDMSTDKEGAKMYALDDKEVQLDIALSQSIMKEFYGDSGLEVRRYHPVFSDEPSFANSSKIPYLKSTDSEETITSLRSAPVKSFTANYSTPQKMLESIGSYRDNKDKISGIVEFKNTANSKNIVYVPEVMFDGYVKDCTTYSMWDEKTSREVHSMRAFLSRDKERFDRLSSQAEYAMKTENSTGTYSKQKNSLTLNAHFSNEGVIDDYGQYIESKLAARKQQFLNEIRSIQFEAINNAQLHLIINELEESDITTKKERDSIFDKLFEAIKKYWLFLLPIIGSNRIQENEEETKYKKKSPINLLGTAWINKDIDKNAKKAATSHTDTIFKTIVEAGKKAEEEIFSRLFVSQYKKKYEENLEEQKEFFDVEPTDRKIKSKLKNPEFVSKNKDIIDFVRKEIDEGKYIQEIQKEIRSKYSTLSNARAKTLVNTETSRATVRSQYAADYEFLKNIGKLDKAYKVLESNTGDPCPICAEIISREPIPFTQEFVHLGDSITVTEGDKSATMTFDYEPVDAGCVHPGCKCSYKLIIK